MTNSCILYTDLLERTERTHSVTENEDNTTLEVFILRSWFLFVIENWFWSKSRADGKIRYDSRSTSCGRWRHRTRRTPPLSSTWHVRCRAKPGWSHRSRRSTSSRGEQ